MRVCVKEIRLLLVSVLPYMDTGTYTEIITVVTGSKGSPAACAQALYACIVQCWNPHCNVVGFRVYNFEARQLYAWHKDLS